MTQHEENGTTERLSAHERLATGSLAHWMRMCANNPWKVVLTWIAIIATLIFLVATIGGSLRDEFSIPGSDTQKATDLIEAEFASEQGAVLNIVFAAPEGERLDTPARKAAIAKAIALLKTDEFKPDKATGKAGLTSVADPFTKDTFSQDGRIAYAEAQFDQTIEDTDRPQVVAVQDAVRQTVEPAGITVEYNGEAEFPPLEQGVSELLGLLAAIIVLLFVFRTFVAMLIPIALAIVALDDGLPVAVHPRRPDRHQHRHADPRLDDRARRRHRLLAVHRHALQTATSRWPRAARRGSRGWFVGRPRGAVRGSHGRHLGGGPRVHRARLRDEARDRERARRAHDRADRELAPDRRPRAARPQGRPAQGAVHEAVRRLGGGTGQDADRTLGPLRHPQREGRLRRAPDHRVRPGGHLGIRAPRRRRPGNAAGGADESPRVRPARRGLRSRVQRADPDRDRREGRRAGAAADRRRCPGDEGRRVGACAAVQRREDGRDRVRDAELGAAGCGDRQPRRPAAERHRAGGDERRPGGRVRLRSDGCVQGHRRPDHQQDARLPAVHHRGDVPPADDGVPVGRGRAHRSPDDDSLGVHRVRRARPGRAAGLPARA